MVVYFYYNQENQDTKLVNEQLKKFGVRAATQKDQEADLSSVDALVVQGDKLDNDANYFIALAIAEAKPVLCLLTKRTADKTVETLEDRSNFKDKVKVIFYQSQDLPGYLSSFLKELDSQAGQEVANIKYTLRINQKISDYLAWKIGNAKRKKAYWLRDQLQVMMEHDESYQKYLQNKYKVE